MTDIPDEKCSIEDCSKPRWQRGWCNGHYKRWWRHGDPLAGRRTPIVYTTAEEAFEAQVIRTDGCWEWTGAISHGYGLLHFAGTTTPAHRWAYEHFVGPIPDGLTLDHLCENTRCVRPTHLDPCTTGDNTRRYYERKNTRERTREQYV